MPRETSFTDPNEYKNAQPGATRFRAEESEKYLIRILTNPYAHAMHYVRTYCNCGLDDNGGGRCLICEQKDGSGNMLHEVQEKYCCLIVLIAKKPVVGGEWTRVDEVMIWGFGADKYRLLYTLSDDVGDIRKVDLLITCTDKQFQKLVIRDSRGKTQVNAELVKSQWDSARKSMESNMRPSTLDRQREVLGSSAVDDGVDESFPLGVANDSPDASAAGPRDISDEVDSILGGTGMPEPVEVPAPAAAAPSPAAAMAPPAGPPAQPPVEHDPLDDLPF